MSQQISPHTQCNQEESPAIILSASSRVYSWLYEQFLQDNSHHPQPYNMWRCDFYESKLEGGWSTNPLDRVVEWEMKLQRIYDEVHVSLETLFHTKSMDSLGAHIRRSQLHMAWIGSLIAYVWGVVNQGDYFGHFSHLPWKNADRVVRHELDQNLWKLWWETKDQFVETRMGNLIEGKYLLPLSQ